MVPTGPDQELFQRLREGDRGALARAITLVESTRPSDREMASALLSAALPFSGNSLRLGITGIPGVGKSTLINALGMLAIDKGHAVAVLATDPSSQRSGGSILGDKTRMEELSRQTKAFIRPTASSGFLGGVAQHTREVIVLCEAAGFDLILVETVGVGQSELEVDRITDLNLLLMIPGAGDELQGIKRGIMESADVIVLTKSDGQDTVAHEAARTDLRNAIAFLPERDSGSRPEVLLTDAITGKGVPELLQHVMELHARSTTTGHLSVRRGSQDVHWLKQSLRDGLMDLLMRDPRTAALLEQLEPRVRSGDLDPFRAAREVLERFRTGDAPLP
ncbi:MAG: methylmalonyl Co-A mutase-associated GTPase MeaB [Flavobacteriales bacterium]|nr:methylmalonyl Co-A mutase-associated GTPase MeaB [Flavobacteriales bacterium]